MHPHDQQTYLKITGPAPAGGAVQVTVVVIF